MDSTSEIKDTLIEKNMRQARSEDRRDIEGIAASAFAVYLDRMDKKPFPMLDDYAAHIARGHAFVLEKNGRVEAFIILIPQDEHTLLLDTLAVAPAAQKSGLGRALVQFAEKQALSQGRGRLSLYTNEAMRENIPWYQRLGFRITHRLEEKGYRRVYFEKLLP